MSKLMGWMSVILLLLIVLIEDIGSVNNLDEAVRIMGKHQLGVNLEANQVRQIVAWLNSLTGEIPKQYIKPP